ncbi:primosomal protein N' [Nocardioides daejeonensis]|uniref:primosomal protein N' n=1 Tax=Nocardioides daejeonensis TaxID=1046556 RepID=UPI000D743305|nr:primosomal protein N' [Nocardioides daejeonensis]
MSQERTQQELLPGMVRAGLRRAPARSGVEIAADRPVAQVLVDLPLAHLDRPFDYLVPASMAEQAAPGARVKVRFAGNDVDGFIVGRVAASEHEGRLQPLRRVVSGEPVLSPAVAELSHLVAERYAGTRADVLRLAVPPRHATTEKAAHLGPAPPVLQGGAVDEAWAGLEHGSEFLAALRTDGSPRAVLAVPPAASWPRLLAEAIGAAYAGGRGALACVPDARDVDRLDQALTELLGAGQHVVLTAEQGPAARYRSFLAVARGERRIVVGNRAAAFAPVHDLGLVVIWDDGDDLHAEPRAPYPHVREVLLLRAQHESTAALVAGHARTVEGEYLLRTGWAHPVQAPREQVRAAVRVGVTGASDHSRERDPLHAAARIPAEAHALIRSGLGEGPVLVQTPRSGYAARLACERCRTPARCRACHGPLSQARPEVAPGCLWCGEHSPEWACPECGHRGLRAPVRGADRTAEELGRSFPGATVRSSSAQRVIDRVGPQPALVVATPGAEPVAESGYRGVILLDTWLLLGRDDLRAEEEALRRWFNAAALVAPGGRVLAVGDPSLPGLQALVRWDPAGHAARELEERRSARLTPASRMATLEGPPGAVSDAMLVLELPEGADILGPVPVPSRDTDVERMVLRVPRHLGGALSKALLDLQKVRSARKLDPVRVQVDPITL